MGVFFRIFFGFGLGKSGGYLPMWAKSFPANHRQIDRKKLDWKKTFIATFNTRLGTCSPKGGEKEGKENGVKHFRFKNNYKNICPELLLNTTQ